MALIDPIQYMTLKGTAPEHASRSSSAAGSFDRHLSRAMNGDDASSLATAGGTAMENALMHNAMSDLASLMRQPQTKAKSASGTAKSTGIGSLSAKFESGSQGVNAIGYDEVGGTSYGTYQIASKPGTMRAFIDFLRDREPRWASALNSAGATDTGSTKGRMPDVWRSIASKNPERFDSLQREFIEQTHYEPAKDKILATTGVDLGTLPPAAQEALWSTAVQHGAAGAARIFNKAIKSLRNTTDSEQFARKLISKVYDNRAMQFGSSTPGVQSSVRNRMSSEKGMVLAMLNEPGAA